MKQFQQPKAEITEAVGRLMDYMESLQRGDFLPYSEVEKIIGVSRGKNRFKYVLEKCRKIVLDGNRGIEMEIAKGVGVRLISVTEQLFNSPIRVRKRAVNQRKKAIKILFGVARSPLDEKQQKYLAQEMASQEQQLKEESNHIRLLRAVQPMEQPLHKRRE